MSTNVIDASQCAKMFLAGAGKLEADKEWINELNVFPVPDGDTGTNMTMTIMSAAKEISAIEELTMHKLAKAMSSGSLRGARGNSGVILSQLLRGFCKGIRDYEEADVPILCAAFQKATETAYKAVMKPKEGTILTVARGVSERAKELLEENPDIEMEDFFEGVIAHGEVVLAHTPDLLPVLKEAGVVDSGGQGLIQILKGAFDAYRGKETAGAESLSDLDRAGEAVSVPREAVYCMEFALPVKESRISSVRDELEKDLLAAGEKLAVIAEKCFIRVHLHTKAPGEVLTRVLKEGPVSRVKVQDLEEGHRLKVVTEEEIERAEKEREAAKEEAEPMKETGFVSVSVGEGLSHIFTDLGVDYIIEGGQTMNPSTEDVINAINCVHAKTVFVFPNNKNIILAATQAQQLMKDKEVIVIPTRTIPQGIAAMLAYMPDHSPKENEQGMYEQIGLVRTCQVTYAVRDTHVDDKEIHEGDLMGVGDKGILAVGQDLADTVMDSLACMISDDSELISVYYGEDVKEEEALKLAERIREEYPDCETEVNQGGQPIYYYIISVE